MILVSFLLYYKNLGNLQEFLGKWSTTTTKFALMPLFKTHAHLRRIVCDTQLSLNFSHSKEDISLLNLCSPKERKTKKAVSSSLKYDLIKSKSSLLSVMGALMELELCIMYMAETQNGQIEYVLYYANIVHSDFTLIQEHCYHT